MAAYVCVLWFVYHMHAVLVLYIYECGLGWLSNFTLPLIVFLNVVQSADLCLAISRMRDDSRYYYNTQW